MNENYNLCIIKPNKLTFSETFIEEHINRLAGNKTILYGGVFPVYSNNGKFLIKSKIALISYLVQKKIFNFKKINVRTEALKNYLINEKIDVVLAEYGMVGAMVTDSCQLANVPLIIHFHGADAHHHKTVEKYKHLYQKAFAYASAIVVVSSDMAKTLKNIGAPKDKVILNPYGVDTDKFIQTDVASSPANFIAVGRFVAKKSPTSVIKSFKQVSEKFLQSHLWMVGDGPLFNKTKQLSVNEGLINKTTYTGVLSSTEIQILMQQMRCFVQHSITASDGDMEGTPNTILEASSSGLPVISTRHAGIKEAVIDGVTGFLVDEHDIIGMAEKMIMLAESPELAAKLGKAGREHMISNYQIDLRIKLLDSIIQKSIKHRQ